MGVKHFYYWYSRNFKQCVYKTLPHPVSILAIDMNGLFHGCAQKIYRYGEFAHSVPYADMKETITRSFLRPSVKTTMPAATARELERDQQLIQKYHKKLFQEVCDKIEEIRKKIKPSTTLVLCVDGVAGLGKMNQQRQRRFRSNQERKDKENDENTRTILGAGIPVFNPNNFTPGTTLMDNLTRYIDVYIRKKQSTCPEWHRLKIIFSNEKAPGEGEHKIMNYIRANSTPKDSVAIHGMDGDLVMLGLLLPPLQNVIIAREQGYYDMEYISVHEFKEKMLEEMDWTKADHEYGYASHQQGVVEDSSRDSQTHAFHAHRVVSDFVVLCFMVGNDFLPTVPALTIMDGGLPMMFHTYREHGKRHGHLTYVQHGTVMFSMKSMGLFLEALSKMEKGLIEKKYFSNATFFHDPVFDKNLDPKTKTVNFPELREDYYEAKFPPGTTPEKICHAYIEGMMWVVNYYRQGIPDWLWSFPYLYGPFLVDLAKYWKTYTPKNFVKHNPVDPFLQLMMVLPPDDQVEMVPKVLHLMKEGSFQEYFPERIEIDLGGKKKEWEGIVKIPLIPYKRFQEFYTVKKTDLCPRDARRNIRGKTFSYHCPQCSTSNTSNTSSSSTVVVRMPCVPPIIQTLVLPH